MLYTNFIFVVLFICLSIPEINAQNLIKSDVEPEIIHTTNSIAFREEGADLAGMKAAIGDKKIVFLGEFFHDEGTTFNAKARIVKYLIEDMGFNVLTYETSLSENYRVLQQAQDKDDFLTYIFDNDYLSASRDQYSFWKYIYSKTTSPANKVDFIGFDVDIGASKFGFLCFLQQELNNIEPGITNTNVWNNYKTTLLDIHKLKPEKLNAFTSQTLSYISLIEKNDYADKERKAYLIQILRSLNGFANFIALNTTPYPFGEELSTALQHFQFHALRDKQMAHNLDWVLRKSLQEGKKIIVWASTYHTSRNIYKLPNPAIDTVKFQPMGHYIWNKYTKEIYSIAFVGYNKSVGHIHHTNHRKDNSTTSVAKIKDESGKVIGKVLTKVSAKPIDTILIKTLLPPPEGSIEKLLHDKGYKYAFVDISKTLKDKTYYMFPTFDQPYLTQWSELYDGIYFMDKIEPFHCRWILNYNHSVDYLNKYKRIWPNNENCKD